MSYEEAGMLFAFGFLFLITLVILVIIWQSFKLVRAKHETKTNHAYEELARDATTNMRELRSELAEVRGDISEMRGRVVAIEKMLREVDS
ncbi:hypothetical protein [Natronoglycomyces albus]|uniref:hypothetical protein n=1 Tax=Natronoglycomyces albus TaxID=2811108 RepID=UPI001FE6287D|nr:hypothetical protein [Natronoglycomyces albus]